MTESRFLTNILFHPVDGFEEMRWQKKGSLRISLIILTVWFIASIFYDQLSGFLFNNSHIQHFNLFIVISRVFFLFILFVVCNWAVCTLFDGEGRLKDIWIAVAYALVPYVISVFIYIIFSRMLILEEQIFLTWIIYIGQGWSGIILVSGLMVVHQYTLKKTLISILITVLGIAFILFLGILLLSLFQEMVAFVITVFREIVFRIRM